MFAICRQLLHGLQHPLLGIFPDVLFLDGVDVHPVVKPSFMSIMTMITSRSSFHVHYFAHHSIF